MSLTDGDPQIAWAWLGVAVGGDYSPARCQAESGERPVLIGIEKSSCDSASR